MIAEIPGPSSLLEQQFIRAVADLVVAEEEEAEAFLVRKNEQAGKVRSDWEARAMAVLDTKGAVTKARGQYEIALHRLHREAPNAD